MVNIYQILINHDKFKNFIIITLKIQPMTYDITIGDSDDPISELPVKFKHMTKRLL